MKVVKFGTYCKSVVKVHPLIQLQGLPVTCFLGSYPRLVDPVRRRPARGYRSGGGDRRRNPDSTNEDDHHDHRDEHYHDQDRSGKGEQPLENERQRRPPRQRRRRPRTPSNQDGAHQSETDDNNDARVAKNEGKAGGKPRDEKRREKPGGERRRSRPRSQPNRGRGRRSRLPRVYTPEEYNKVHDPVEALGKRLGDKKGTVTHLRVHNQLYEEYPF